MIPAGYMYKFVSPRPDWLQGADHVVDICSVSGCFSKDFTDFVTAWQHNGYWFFDDPAIMKSIAQDRDVDLSGATLFYYETEGVEYDQDQRQWRPVTPDDAFPLAVVKPSARRLLGFDLATYSCGNAAECSPLSCNAMAAEVAVNRHCLAKDAEVLKAAVEAGAFDDCEPGPLRILAVYAVDTDG